MGRDARQGGEQGAQNILEREFTPQCLRASIHQFASGASGIGGALTALTWAVKSGYSRALRTPHPDRTASEQSGTSDMNADAVRRILRDRLLSFKTQKDLALAIGISPQYLNGVMHGSRPPNGRVLTFLRLERVVTYRRFKR